MLDPIEVVRFPADVDPEAFDRLHRTYDVRDDINLICGQEFVSPYDCLNNKIEGLSRILTLEVNIEGVSTVFETWMRDERRIVGGAITAPAPYSWHERNGLMLPVNGAALRRNDGLFELEVHYIDDADDPDEELDDSLGMLGTYFVD